MTKLRTACLALAFFLACGSSWAGPQTGPVVENFGPVYDVPAGSFNLDATQDYAVIMDVSGVTGEPGMPNPGIESAARFLNMHARNGIERRRLKLAVVLHGPAAAAALTDEAHTSRFDMPNVNKALLEALGRAGVAVYLCGQSAAHRGFEPGELLPEVDIAVSAMTVHVRLQQEGYRAILF
ncbi:MAG: DsrE family protein [Silicimonas sp.]|nr:DsrE family protein [Silicimonas sp.]